MQDQWRDSRVVEVWREREVGEGPMWTFGGRRLGEGEVVTDQFITVERLRTERRFEMWYEAVEVRVREEPFC